MSTVNEQDLHERAEHAEAVLADLRKQLTEREGEAIDEQNLRFDAEKKLERAEAELERVKKVCAEMREALITVREWDDNPKEPYTPEMIVAVRHALSSDAGRDYVHRSEVEKRNAVIKEMREALKGVINSAVHPDVAIRSVMVPLDPIRKALASAKEEGL